MKMPIPHFRQQGVSLVVTLILVVLLSLLALYGAGVLVQDTRSAANDYRAREALASAESGIDQGFGLLNANRAKIKSTGFDVNANGTIDAGEGWTTCTATDAVCQPIESGDRTNWQYLTLSSTLIKRPWKDDDADGVKDAAETYLGDVNVYLVTPSSGDDARLVYNIVAVGKSGDASGTVTAKQGAYFYPLVVGTPKSPLMAYGTIANTGNYNVVTNPDGGGSGVEVTAWSHTTVSISGSAATCQLGNATVGGAVGTGFLSTDNTYSYQTDSDGNTLTMCDACTCPTSDSISKGGVEGTDIVMNDTTNFPTDVFQYLFGVPYTDYQQVKAKATVVSDCTGLNTASAGLIWVTGGACNISASVGSYDTPVMLVVEDQNTQINANGYFFGVIFAFDTTPASPTTLDVQMNGTFTLYGAVMTNSNIDLGAGTYKMRFDKNVLANLANNPNNRTLSRIPGSWSDVQ